MFNLNPQLIQRHKVQGVCNFLSQVHQAFLDKVQFLPPRTHAIVGDTFATWPLQTTLPFSYVNCSEGSHFVWHFRKPEQSLQPYINNGRLDQTPISPLRFAGPLNQCQMTAC